MFWVIKNIWTSRWKFEYTKISWIYMNLPSRYPIQLGFVPRLLPGRSNENKQGSTPTFILQFLWNTQSETPIWGKKQNTKLSSFQFFQKTLASEFLKHQNWQLQCPRVAQSSCVTAPGAVTKRWWKGGLQRSFLKKSKTRKGCLCWFYCPVPVHEKSFHLFMVCSCLFHCFNPDLILLL